MATYANIEGSASTGVTLTASPTAGNAFAGWSGACSAAGTALTAAVTLGATTACTATFSAIVLTPAVLANAAVGTAYSASFSTSGGSTPYAYAVATGTNLAPGLMLSGSGGLSGTPTAAGAYSFGITVTDNNGFGLSRTYSLSVARANSSTSVAAVPATTVYGQSLTLTATIATANPNVTGTVAFTESSVALPGCSAVALAGGQAACQVASLSVGSHPITAAYSGDSNTAASTSAVAAAVTVNKASTTTTLTPPGAITLGNPVSVNSSVTIVSPGAGSLSGSITITDGGAAAGDSCTISLPGTSCTLTPSSAGNKTLSATYSPDAIAASRFSGSSATGSVLVNAGQPGLVVTSSSNPSVLGQAVNLTATVTPASGAPNATGALRFYVDSVEICSGTLLTVVSAGSASCAVPAVYLSVGNHPVTVSYAGDSNNLAANAALALPGQIVNKASTTTSITPPSAINLGSSVTVNVTVTAQAPGSGTPGGSVTVSDGSASCLVTLSGGTGSCLLTPPAPAGSHQLSALYAASANFASSTGSSTLTVNAAPAGTVLTSSVNPVTAGQTVTLTATVTPISGNPAPTGTVAFSEAGVALSGCANVAVSGGVASCTLSSLSVGSHTVQASYSGDTNTAASSATLGQGVVAVVSRITLAVSPNPATVGQPVVLTATVTQAVASASNSGSASPDAARAKAVQSSAALTGSVTFSDGGVTLGTVPLNNGQAVLVTSFARTAGHTITATYSGDNSYTSATISLLLQVDAPVPVPTLSTWLMCLLGFALAGAGARVVRARRELWG